MEDPNRSLDLRAYRLKLYPEIGDFSISPVVRGRPPGAPPPRGIAGGSTSLDICSILSDGSGSLYRQDWRAKAKIGRYCRRNDLKYSVTLTYARSEVSWEQMTADYRKFLIRLRYYYSFSVPFLAVPELTKKRRYHLQSAFDRYIPHADLARIWGHGFVFITFRESKGERSGAEQNGAYTSKYVVKAIGETERPPGANRYFMAQGFQPITTTTDFEAVSPAAVVGQVVSAGLISEPSWVSLVEDVPNLIVGRSIPLLAA